MLLDLPMAKQPMQFLFVYCWIAVIVIMSGCSSDQAKGSSSGTMITDSLVIDEKYYDNAIRTSTELDSAAIKRMHIEEIPKQFGRGFKYHLLDTILFKNGAKALIISAAGQGDETFAYFVTYPGPSSPSVKMIYYDIYSACYQTSSVIYADGKIITRSYDCEPESAELITLNETLYKVDQAGETKEESHVVLVKPEYDEQVLDIKTDTIATSIVELDAIIQKLSSDPAVEIIENIGYTWGDCDGSYRKLSDKKGNTLYIFKNDCGEYGYGNDQFWLRNDSLLISRHYGLSQAWDDNDEITFILEEEVYTFKNGKITVKKREKQGHPWQLRTLANVSFRDSIMDYDDACFEETNELEELLQLQELGEEEEIEEGE